MYYNKTKLKTKTKQGGRYVQKKEEIGADGSSTSVESYHYDSNGNVSSTTLKPLYGL